MEIKKQNIHMNYEKASAMSQITLDDDYNLPDYRPDIVKVLKEKGEIRFDEIQVKAVSYTHLTLPTICSV